MMQSQCWCSRVAHVWVICLFKSTCTNIYFELRSSIPTPRNTVISSMIEAKRFCIWSLIFLYLKFSSWPWDQWLLVIAVILHIAFIPLKDLPLEEASSFLIASVTVFTKMEKLHVADSQCTFIKLKQINRISVMDVTENQLP